MIGIAVYLNGKELTVAGAEDFTVLHAMVNAIGRLGNATRKVRRGADLFLSVGGLTGRPNGLEDEHLTWVRHQRLRVGDRVSLRIVRTDRTSKHQGASPAGGNMEKMAEKSLKRMNARKKRSARAKGTLQR